ncbi:hypothetical protein RQP46_003852 [Phenoliferia psychrophenolica]
MLQDDYSDLSGSESDFDDELDDELNEMEDEMDDEFSTPEPELEPERAPSPLPLPAPPTTSSAADKGKGRESDALEDGETSTGDAARDPEDAATTPLRAARDALAALRGIDNETVSTLVQLDPTPVSHLSTSTKLMKAITILQNQQQQQHTPFPAYPPPPPPHGSYYAAHPMPPLPPPSRPLPSSTYTSLLELLASALADVSAPTPGPRESRRTAEYKLAVARANLSLNHSGQQSSTFSPPPPPPLFHPGSYEEFELEFGTPSSSSSPAPPPLAPSSQPTDTELDATLAHLMAENTRITLLKLRPSFLPKPSAPVTPPPRDPTLTPPKASSPIGKLPAEILAEIFRIARKLAEERPVEMSHQSHPNADPYELIRPARVRRGAGYELHGSRTAAQRFVQSLALVSKSWQATSRSIAYASVHLRKKTQLPKLLDVLGRNDCHWREHIVSLNVKLPVSNPDPGVTNALGGRRAGALARHMSATAFGWAQPGPSGSQTSAQRLQEDAESPSVHFSRLIAASPNLQQLSLTVIGYAYSVPFGARHQTTDFLDPQILATLSSISTLTSLTLGTSVDFEELEVILAGMPSLRELYLEGGFDDVNQRGVVTSAQPHVAQLRTLVIGNGQTSYRDYTCITDVQLAFLLEPAVATLRHLDITIMSNGGGPVMGGWAMGGPGGGGGGPQAPTPPCFASGLFADLLVRMGPTIERLALRDLQAFGGATPSLALAPHSGTFDHALSHCTSLQQLSLQFQYTGAGLLDALAPSGHTLESLLFLGTPTALPADDLASTIELGVHFPVLRRLVVSGQYVGRGPAGAGWTGPQVRRLKAVTKEKGILCVLAT